MTLSENVARGAAWLDRRQPDWADRINLSTLDLRSSELCVAGQALGTAVASGYDVMFAELHVDMDNDRPDVTYGFTHPSVTDKNAGPYGHPYAPADPRLQELAALWTAQIAIRRSQPQEETP